MIRSNLKRIILFLSILMCYCQICASASIYYNENDDISFTVNNVSIPVKGYEIGKPWDNCWTFANIIYEKIWGTQTGKNMLEKMTSDTELAITEENTRNYITAAKLGANIRVDDRKDKYMHSMILVQKDPIGFTVYQGNWNGRINLRYFSYADFAQHFAEYKYFAYISYPQAPAYRKTGSEIIAVFRKSGKMTDIQITDSLNDINFPEYYKADEVTVYLWDSVKKMKPLCEKKTIMVDDWWKYFSDI